MPLILGRDEAYESGGVKYLSSNLQRNFVCAVCGSRLTHTFTDIVEIYTCSNNSDHNDIIHQSLYEKFENERIVEMLEKSHKESARLRAVASRIAPEISNAIETTLQERADALYPKDDGI